MMLLTINNCYKHPTPYKLKEKTEYAFQRGGGLSEMRNLNKDSTRRTQLSFSK